MRFAAAPLGDLRWRAPVEPPKVEGLQRANHFPPICLGINAGYPVPAQDEDCLFANVWAPSKATATSKLPVWVFIGGGGYVALTNANWNGAEVVEKSGQNIVFVNFNYRVGALGFLASERVREDGDLNVGMLDQRMLMEWVKKHIASFGGDPDHVVIHGASAGAGSVAMHLVAHGGRDDNLFVGVMAESIFFPAQPFVSELEYQFDRFVHQTGCDNTSRSDQMACLRSRPIAVLQNANTAQPFPGQSESPYPLFYWTPCVDGDFLPDLPYALINQGKIIDVPVLFGTDTDEGSVFTPATPSPSSFLSFLTSNFPLLTPNHTASVLALYSPPLPPLPGRAPWFPTASRAYGEATFICPTSFLLSAVRHSRRYAYRYNVRDDEVVAAGLGVPHLFEAAAVFGPDNIGGHAVASYKTYNRAIVDVVQGYWISFVRGLDPNLYRRRGSPRWEVWGEGRGTRMVLETGKSGMEVVGGRRGEV
ncbi:Alpha/Beta hydrolase protein [Schizothecium vesticola]|uniref:Carboxylic ester hydrolase n=1 Tax=Schizothecium vesticola TaxID=314040 RepID=A0AA40F5I8_9PEZI|nr:Alpha/Beta hydrolase protein [Schizothecium vesticola]